MDLIRRSGGTLTTGYLSQLLSGDRKNPGVAIVTQIAEFFRVPVDYFGSAESYLEIRRHIEWIVSLRDSGTDQLAARTTSDPRDALSIGLREIRRNAGDSG
ncbi:MULTISPECIES: XRE family transcriptional regulator [unclassified Nocardia]|uniref:XRE family transcriptional regulator n=1 Tax=unclassified Nocardia TaxID=2637762 RepID=UPI00278BFAD2|nr:MULTISPECIES: XRE family transcriptional regulator [unclassified Nocardia]